MSPSRRAAPRAVAAALLLAAVVTGCEDQPASPGPTNPASESTPPAPTTSDPTAPTSEPPSSEPTDPGAEAATGPELMMDAATLRLPEGWELDENQASYLASGNGADVTTGNIGLSQLPSGNPDVTGAQLDRITNQTRFDGEGEIRDPVDVAGVEMRHVRGKSGMRFDEQYLAVVEGDLVAVTFSLPDRFDTPERDALVASVLASVTWS